MYFGSDFIHFWPAYCDFGLGLLRVKHFFPNSVILGGSHNFGSGFLHFRANFLLQIRILSFWSRIHNFGPRFLSFGIGFMHLDGNFVYARPKFFHFRIELVHFGSDSFMSGPDFMLFGLDSCIPEPISFDQICIHSFWSRSQSCRCQILQFWRWIQSFGTQSPSSRTQILWFLGQDRSFGLESLHFGSECFHFLLFKLFYRIQTAWHGPPARWAWGTLWASSAGRAAGQPASWFGPQWTVFHLTRKVNPTIFEELFF